MKRTLLVILTTLASAAAQAEPANVIRATELRKEPATDAPVVAQLAEGTAVDALERKSGWVRVKLPGGSEGWVRMLLVRYGAQAASMQTDSGVGQILNVARTGSSGTQVTTGVRGLDSEKLANAQPNPAELEKMRAYAADRQQAESFASQGPLRAQRIDYPKEEGQ
jgi:SH3-like domain-containing protein